MAFVHGKDASVLFDDKNLTAYFNSSEFGGTRDYADVTPYGQAGHKFLPGLRAGVCTLKGFFDGAANAVDAELNEAFTATGIKPLTIAYEALTVGNRTKIGGVRESEYSASSPVDGAVATSATLQSDTTGFLSGHSLHALSAETATANGTSVDGGTATTTGGFGVLHVTAYSGFTSVAINIQDSADNVSFANIGSFASVTGVTGEAITFSGNVRRYVRASWTVTGSGSITFHISFSRT